MQEQKDLNKQDDIDEQVQNQGQKQDQSDIKADSTSNQTKDENNSQQEHVYVVPRYLQKALYTRSKALNENFRDYGVPTSIQENLRALDNTEGALSKGSRYEDPNAPKEYIEALHKQQQQAQDDEDDLEQSRIYKKAKSHIYKVKSQEQSLKDKLSKNFKIVLVVIVGLIGYYMYGNYIREMPNELDELKQALPLKIDEYTTIEKIDEDDKGLTMYIVKANELYAGSNPQEIQTRLDNVAQGAQNMCKIPIIYSMIESGKTLTVLLSTQDDAYKSSIIIDKCIEK